MNQSAPLILTLGLDEHSSGFFNAKRRQFFPPERNFIPAHLTLFHKLPGEYLDAITRGLEVQSLGQQPFTLDVVGLRSLGRGVAYTLVSGELETLRRTLAREWDEWLQPQDRQKHQPHVTVQNKVSPQEAKALLLELTSTFVPFKTTGVGMDLWCYRGGPWEKIREFRFAP